MAESQVQKGKVDSLIIRTKGTPSHNSPHNSVPVSPSRTPEKPEDATHGEYVIDPDNPDRETNRKKHIKGKSKLKKSQSQTSSHDIPDKRRKLSDSDHDGGSDCDSDHSDRTRDFLKELYDTKESGHSSPFGQPGSQ